MAGRKGLQILSETSLLREEPIGGNGLIVDELSIKANDVASISSTVFYKNELGDPASLGPGRSWLVALSWPAGRCYRACKL